MTDLNDSDNNPSASTKTASLSDIAKEALRESKEFINTICNLERNLNQEVSIQFDDKMKEIVNKVRQNPLKSILIAGGVGYLLSSLRKHK